MDYTSVTQNGGMHIGAGMQIIDCWYVAIFHFLIIIYNI